MSSLLLTATIDSGVFGNLSTVVSDTTVRKKQYMDTLEKYIVNTKISKIIFAENSGADFNVSYFQNLCKQYGKEFEYLFLPCDYEAAIKYGKSYGEAKLIADAVCQSKLLMNEEKFFKASGRVFVSNIDKYLNDDSETRFIAYNYASWLLTVFFMADKKIFNEYLSKAYLECDECNGKPIEQVYYKIMIKENRKVKCFKTYPRMTGVVGGSGKKYDKSLINILIRNILIKLGFFDLKKKKGWYDKILYKKFMGY